MSTLRFAFAQLNPTVGDIEGNIELIVRTTQAAAREKCRLVLFPELMVTGYPPEDLLLKPAFVSDSRRALVQAAKRIKNVTAVIGFVDEKKGRRFNAAAWIENSRVRHIYHKRCLPNYGVFDEARYFSPGEKPLMGVVGGIKVAITICEDIWVNGRHLAALKAKKPDIIANISASPFHAGKLRERQRIFQQNLKFLKTSLLYCNMVGGQDELVFDGASFAATPQGRVVVQAPSFEAGLFVAEMETQGSRVNFTSFWKQATPLSSIEEILEALMVGTRDYVNKNRFKKVVLGLSGGIDSALVAAIAVQAVGRENVIGVTMPSRFNAKETQDDAALLAENLGIRFIRIPIQDIYAETLTTLGRVAESKRMPLAEENLQARIRGNLLMALSNEYGWLVLTTGNKSETSTGYSTLYGDTAGGFAVLKDVLKTTVYELARHINERAGTELIPNSVITRPPTAELRENQKDEDSLGAYADLDPLITGYVERNLPPAFLIKKSRAKADYVNRVVKMIDRSEYKRRQAPPGVKITPRSFGRDHRMPITNRYEPR